MSIILNPSFDSSDLFSFVHFDDPFTNDSCARIPFSTEVAVQCGRAIADAENERFYIHDVSETTVRLNYTSLDGAVDGERWVDSVILHEPSGDNLGRWEVIRRLPYISPYSGKTIIEYRQHPVVGSIRRLIRKDFGRQDAIRLYFSKRFNEMVQGDIYVYPTAIDLGTQLTYATSKHTFMRLFWLGRHVSFFGGNPSDMESAVLTGYRLESRWLREQEDNETAFLDRQAMYEEANS